MPKEPRERPHFVNPEDADRNTAGQLADQAGFDTSVPFKRPPMFSSEELAQLQADDANAGRSKKSASYPDIRTENVQRPIQESIINSLLKLMKGDEEPRERQPMGRGGDGEKRLRAESKQKVIDDFKAGIPAREAGEDLGEGFGGFHSQEHMFESPITERWLGAGRSPDTMSPESYATGTGFSGGYNVPDSMRGERDPDTPVIPEDRKADPNRPIWEQRDPNENRPGAAMAPGGQNVYPPRGREISDMPDTYKVSRHINPNYSDIQNSIEKSLLKLMKGEGIQGKLPQSSHREPREDYADSDYGAPYAPFKEGWPTGQKQKLVNMGEDTSFPWPPKKINQRAAPIEESLLKLMNYEVAPMQKINLGQAARGFGRGLMNRKWKTEDALSSEERAASPKLTSDAAQQAEARHVSDHYRFNPDEAKGEEAAKTVRQSPMHIAERVGSEFNPGGLEDAIRAGAGKGAEFKEGFKGGYEMRHDTDLNPPIGEKVGGAGPQTGPAQVGERMGYGLGRASTIPGRMVESVKRFAQPESAYQPPSRPGIGEPTVDHIPYEYKSPQEQNRLDLAHQSRIAGLRGQQENKRMAEDPSRAGKGPMELSKILKSLENIMKAPADAGLQAQQRASRRQAGQQTQANIGQSSQAGHAAMGQAGQQAQSDAAQTQALGAGIVDQTIYALAPHMFTNPNTGMPRGGTQPDQLPNAAQSGGTGATQGTGTIQQTAGGGTDQQMDTPGTQTPTPKPNQLNMEKPWKSPQVNVPQPKQTPTS